VEFWQNLDGAPNALGAPTFDPVDVGLNVIAVEATQGSYTYEDYFVSKNLVARQQ
jgi:hypothetical protein